MRRAAIAAMLVSLATSAPATAAGEPIAAEQTLAAATEHFRVGAASLESDHAKARDELNQAIAGFQRLIDEYGARNGQVYYNIANAHLLLGEEGRAILNYRRAARYIPTDANLAANLAVARQRVPNRIDAPAGERVRRALLFWHDETSPRTRFRASLWTYAAAWALAVLRVTGILRIGGWWLVGAAGVVTAALGASLLIEHRAADASSQGVIVAAQTIGRKGPDVSAYEPTFTEPLHGGVEVIIVERRPGWTLTRLGDGRETWVAADDVEAVQDNTPAG